MDTSSHLKFRPVSKWIIAGILIASSLVLAVIHALLFHDIKTFCFYLLLDIALIPLQVLIVSMILERLLKEHDKRNRLAKMNMVIGAFFSEVGTALLNDLLTFSRRAEDASKALSVTSRWEDADFQAAAASLNNLTFAAANRADDLARIKQTLALRRDFLLGLLGNQNLLEHEQFTHLLWAVFHLMEELNARPALDPLPATDTDHLAGDIQRAAALLVEEWLAYMQHLQRHYPYLFSLAVRMNPFVANRSPIIV